jgi:hypothetical protein
MTPDLPRDENVAVNDKVGENRHVFKHKLWRRENSD